MVKKNILGTIGGTPMVRINRLCPNPNVKIFAKLEGFNPTGSIKDRIALRMIEAAERDGRLTPGKTIIEPTSGNTGIGLAIVGIVKGYPVEIVMSEAVSIERRKIIRSYGAKVILTPAEEGTDGAIRLARKKVADAPGRYFMPDQFANASNYLAHYQSTALEIWQQPGGNIDYLVCAIGTSGTLMGLSRFLKVMKPDIKVVCAQPIRGHYIQGLKNMEEAIVPDIYDPSQIDVQEMIESEEAISMAREIIRREAIFAGMSSGAAMLAMTAALIPLDHPELLREPFITREAVGKTLGENSGTDAVVAFLRENMERSTMRRLHLMGDCRYIFLYEQLMPQAMVEEQRADSMEAMQKRLDEGRYDYAFVGNLEPDGFLAQGGLQANTLYAVVYDEAGRATLERAASME